jgi:hypothetical protein
MTSTRISTFTVEGPRLDLFVSDCTCGVVFGIPKDLEARRREDGKAFYCPNGHSLYFSDRERNKEKIRRLEATEIALKDQLAAAVREAEQVRQALLRDRHRFANGVCPCCNRSFENVRRHMSTQHPDYDATQLARAAAVRFRCSCGREFTTLRGLRTHQGHVRPDDWAVRGQKGDFWSRRSAHLTETGARR